LRRSATLVRIVHADSGDPLAASRVYLVHTFTLRADSVSDLSNELSDLFDEIISVKVVRQKERPGNRITFGQISSAGMEGNVRLRGPALVLEAGSLDMSRFQMAPETRANSTFGLYGGSDIDFDDSPKFSDAYFLHSWAEEPTRILFTKELRDWFARHCGWRVRARGRVLLLYRLSNVPELDDATFVKQGQKICSLFRAGEHELDLRPDVSREGSHEDMKRTAAKMGLGNTYQKYVDRQKVTPDELSRFEMQAPPREIPPGMKRQLVKYNFLSGGLGVAFLLMATGTIIKNHETAEHFGVVGVLATVALTLILFPLYRRMQKARILSEGPRTTGEVNRVERTNTSVNDRQLYRIYLSYEVNGVCHSSVITGFQDQADRARRFVDSGEPVQLLYDPGSPRQCVCLDLVFVHE
jgi:hypothetical protein